MSPEQLEKDLQKELLFMWQAACQREAVVTQTFRNDGMGISGYMIALPVPGVPSGVIIQHDRAYTEEEMKAIAKQVGATGPAGVWEIAEGVAQTVERLVQSFSS